MSLLIMILFQHRGVDVCRDVAENWLSLISFLYVVVSCFSLQSVLNMINYMNIFSQYVKLCNKYSVSIRNCVK
jgi:hypothetical protein